ncbi:asparaginase [Catelliglobosispora koreensis]|uniref:asparaginase n=1 Tax=Catelliglobosispora koreensis TaxID=129052 RepID=UPI000363249B|nr:asparaginase [Catelliglobosispora koreensis]
MGRVVLFTLGGTIAMAAATDPVNPQLSGKDLVAQIPGAPEVLIRDIAAKPAGWLSFDEIALLAKEIRQSNADGYVVSMGTDTLEEVAFLLDLWHDGDKPVVVTGAMRHPQLAGPDGPANLLAALQVAGSPAAAGRGVLAVLNDEIHAARWVRKGHTSSPAAFSSPGAGPVGVMAEGVPLFHSGPSRRQHVNLPVREAKVGLIVATLSSDGGELTAYQMDGLVVAGFGVGHVPKSWIDPLTELSQRMPVVLASRTGAGPVLNATYAFPGSESDLRERGLIGAGQLDPFKARVMLWALLAAGATSETIAATFTG